MLMPAGPIPAGPLPLLALFRVDEEQLAARINDPTSKEAERPKFMGDPSRLHVDNDKPTAR